MNRSTLYLGIAAAVLVLLAVVLVRPGRDPLGRDRGERGTLFTLPEGAEVDRIEVRAPGTAEVVLERAASGWHVTSEAGFPADTAAVNAVLRAVGGVERGPVVSRNADKQAVFEVDEASGVGVALGASGRSLARFTVGKAGPDFTTSYIRVADGKDVFLARGLNRNLFNRTQGFRDRTLARFEPEQVASLTVAAADTGWVVARADSAWTLTSPDGTSGAANEALVNTALRSLSAFMADGFVEAGLDTLPTGLAAPEITVTIRLLGGNEQTVSIGGRNERGQRFAARPDRDAVYLVGEWRLNPFRRRAAGMLAAD